MVMSDLENMKIIYKFFKTESRNMDQNQIPR